MAPPTARPAATAEKKTDAEGTFTTGMEAVALPSTQNLGTLPQESGGQPPARRRQGRREAGGELQEGESSRLGSADAVLSDPSGTPASAGA